MPDYVRAMNNSKSLSGLETPEIYFVLSCTSTGLICATSISLSTKNFHLHASMTGQEGRLGNLVANHRLASGASI